MKRGAAVINRLLVLVVGLALAVAGAGALAWDRGVATVRKAASHLDRDQVAAVPDQPWWHWALGAAVAICLVLGVVVLVIDLTRRRAAPSTMPETSTDTPIAIDLGPIATGVAAELERLPGVRRGRGREADRRPLRLAAQG
ncbi:MAG: hypothetical protein FWE39_05365, partial [Nocardiaceae bacterium]|nr:hypothetical protein [Nocardiaceae bacterium]